MTSRRGMRRQARRIRRTGFQPMMMLDAGDQPTQTAMVMLARWVRHYRSELAPVFLAAVVVGTGWYLHIAHRSWWVALVILTVVAVSVLTLVGHRLGIPTRGERLYAAAVAVSVGGWLTAAALVEPGAAPLPLLLVRRPLAGLGLAVPWWAQGTGPRRTHTRGRAGRLAGHVGGGGPVGLAGPAASGPGANH